MAILLSSSDADRLVAHARRAYPRECCGVLLGRDCGENHQVERVVPASNIAEDDQRTNYQLDWSTLFRVVRAARLGPQRILGFYHSHPDGSTRPSRRDRQAAWIDYAYLIVSTDGHTRSGLSGWRMPAEGTEFHAETVEISALPDGSSAACVAGTAVLGRIPDAGSPIMH